MNQKIYSVSSVTQDIKSLLIDDFSLNHIYVRGEVSNCKYHTSGHIYFTLKDKGSAMTCVMFASQRKGLGFRLAEGQSVVVYGSMGVYERDGRYQLYASMIRQEGAGQLYEAYEALKKKLFKEGLFDQAHKKALPAYPARLGIVTARTGAALQDMLNVSLRRNPWIQIVFCQAQVQGEGAASSVIRSIKALDGYGVDVMIVGRGGGSIEDLWAFNDEELARTVYACNTPIVSAVGHETDTTIIDYVSDLRAPTPSAAAELAVPDMMKVLDRMDSYKVQLHEAMDRVVDRSRDNLASYQRFIRHMEPQTLIRDKRQRLIEIDERMRLIIDRNLIQCKARLAVGAQQLDGASPLRQLSRGYAYVTGIDGHSVTHVNQVGPGDELNIAVTDGDIKATVIDTQSLARV